MGVGGCGSGKEETSASRKRKNHLISFPSSYISLMLATLSDDFSFQTALVCNHEAKYIASESYGHKVHERNNTGLAL